MNELGGNAIVISVENLNQTFLKYPVTVEDKGWIYGVWYCSTPWRKAKLYGEYPATFLKRALALFPDAVDILHAPSGTLESVSGITLDLVADDVRHPDYVACCSNMPFRNGSFDLILSDPPYSKKDSAIYGCPPFPMNRFVKEAHRVLRPGGYLGVLHVYYPSYRRKDWKLVGLIAIITGFMRMTRIFSIFERKITVETKDV
ncbi:hypothetical protein LCGC14_3027420 [marine sediment metagenome]|uniref:Methyltransferase type 11 domain-containing protein n=1 Tax=marine sediment metagenome TaxID=412755 RepID=A0A0F8WT97_9ZZZZ